MAENFVKQIDGSYDSEANVYNSILNSMSVLLYKALLHHLDLTS